MVSCVGGRFFYAAFRGSPWGGGVIAPFDMAVFCSFGIFYQVVLGDSFTLSVSFSEWDRPGDTSEPITI